jgi:outer membrane protein assembly factor BamB
VNTATGKIAWKIRTADPADSGMLVAGDLVFYGETSGLFHAVNAATGSILWTFNATTVPGGGGATAAPIAYAWQGREYIANGFGGNPMEGGSPLGDAVIAFAVPGQ